MSENIFKIPDKSESPNFIILLSQFKGNLNVFVSLLSPVTAATFVLIKIF